MTKYKVIIGRTEPIDIAGIAGTVPAKTDTGAYTSAIHAKSVREETLSNGQKVLRCTLLGDHPVIGSGVELEVKEYTTVHVENSFGHSQQRYVIFLKVKIAGRSFVAPFTLADRSKKVFPVLLGRTLLNKRFIVDSSMAHIDRKVLKTKMNVLLEQDDREDDINT